MSVVRETIPRLLSGPLEVNVIFSGLRETSAALNFAQSMARDLRARIRLQAAIAVPFPLPLDRPPISVPFLQTALRNLVSQLEKQTFDPAVNLCFCRDRVRALLQVLKPNSLVVIAGRKRWWPTAETRMANALRAKGHQVVFVDSKKQCVSGRPVVEPALVAR